MVKSRSGRLIERITGFDGLRFADQAAVSTVEFIGIVNSRIRTHDFSRNCLNSGIISGDFRLSSGLRLSRDLGLGSGLGLSRSLRFSGDLRLCGSFGLSGSLRLGGSFELSGNLRLGGGLGLSGSFGCSRSLRCSGCSRFSSRSRLALCRCIFCECRAGEQRQTHTEHHQNADQLLFHTVSSLSFCFREISDKNGSGAPVNNTV